MIIDSRYEVLEKLSQSPWATVYKVLDTRTSNQYILKLFQNITPEEFYKKFTAEDMHHITKIEHPNLVHVTSFGIHENEIYLLSDFYPGRNLRYFSFKGFQLDIIYSLIVQVCYGLNALHSQNIIHQDLKPENIMYQLDGSNILVKILDYGFLRGYNDDDKVKLGGTLPYIAPEVLLGAAPSPQSDFYALGITLYKLTTGAFPFTIEQINSFISGRAHTVFPRFPKELNSDIPLQLEKLILRLLEVKPENRFENAEEIIYYVNRSQERSYPFSVQRSLVDSMRFSGYLVREDYSHELLEFVPLVCQGNGKIIVVKGGQGLGKNNLLSLFRYHLLTNKYFMFDYECAAGKTDPFFALLKEFYSFIGINNKLSKELELASNKFEKFMLTSETEAMHLTTSRTELEKDFAIAKDFLFELSQQRPLIFIIRHGQYLTQDTIDFVNYLGNELQRHKVLIIFSVNDPNHLSRLEFAVDMRVKPLGLDETAAYVQKLLGQQADAGFIRQLWQRTNGNPLFVRNTLIDLTEKDLLFHEGEFNFDIHLDEYLFPDELNDLIYRRLSFLTGFSYDNLKKVAVAHTPLSKKLIAHLTGLNDKDLMRFLHEVTQNEVITRRDHYYYFSFAEVKHRFLSEISADEKARISRLLLEFFAGQDIYDERFCVGIIHNAHLAADWDAVHNYKLGLVKLYERQYDQLNAYHQMHEVLKLDYSDHYKPEQTELRADLRLFLQKALLTGSIRSALELVDSLDPEPERFGFHFVRGVLLTHLDMTSKSEIELQMALDHAPTHSDRVDTLLELAWAQILSGEVDIAGLLIDDLLEQELTVVQQMRAHDRRSIILGSKNQLIEAVNLLEDYLPRLQQESSIPFIMAWGNIFNNLAFLYSNLRETDSAERYFHRARELWEGIHYTRVLPTVYNNIGDIAVRQGNTAKALKYFNLAKEIFEDLELPQSRILGYVNFGEFYIKTGEFSMAITYLDKARQLIEQIETKDMLESVHNNLALAKSKSGGYGNYYQFVKENQPGLQEGKIETLTPLVKSWFYYLFNTGQANKVKQLLQDNPNLDFADIHEEEFFEQVQGLITLQEDNTQTAIGHFETSLSLARRNRTTYGETINLYRLVQAHLASYQPQQAKQCLLKALDLATANNYTYWKYALQLLKVKVDLFDPAVPLRLLLRDLSENLAHLKERDYYNLVLDNLLVTTQIYLELQAGNDAADYYQQLLTYLELYTTDLPIEDTEILFKRFYCLNQDISEVQMQDIMPRTHCQTGVWHEELYELMRLKEVKRIKFFIGRLIKRLVAPWAFAVLYEERPLFAVFQSENLPSETLYSQIYRSKMEQCLEEGRILTEHVFARNVLFIPLGIKRARIGVLVVSDNGELPFSDGEVNVLAELQLHLSSLLTRVQEYQKINFNMQLIEKLMEGTARFFSTLENSALEREIIRFCIDFTGATRGLLIKRGKSGNFTYVVAMNQDGEYISNEASVSKTVLSEVQLTGEAIFTLNAKEDNAFKSAISVQDYDLHSIYCAPIYVDGNIYGFIYLDDYERKQQSMIIPERFMDMLFRQITASLKNTLQYEMLMEKTIELHTLDQVKENFMAIVSHELNTPLVALQGYINKLLRDRFETPEAKKEVSKKIRNNLRRLATTTTDIVNMNRYRVARSLPRTMQKLDDILELLVEEAKITAMGRAVDIKIDIEPDLPELLINQQAFHLMIYNLVLNGIRYTKDHGMVQIGARRSAFAAEEISGKSTVIIYVTDTGDGIEEEELKNIFKSFYEVKDIFSHKSGVVEYDSSGLGLGLTTAKRIAELHQGRIWLDSKAGIGTTVYVAIPIGQSPLAMLD